LRVVQEQLAVCRINHVAQELVQPVGAQAGCQGKRVGAGEVLRPGQFPLHGVTQVRRARLGQRQAGVFVNGGGNAGHGRQVVSLVDFLYL
jgi:hypothetical protein